jgi:hypothetical protein
MTQYSADLCSVANGSDGRTDGSRVTGSAREERPGPARSYLVLEPARPWAPASNWLST